MDCDASSLATQGDTGVTLLYRKRMFNFLFFLLWVLWEEKVDVFLPTLLDHVTSVRQQRQLR